MKTTKILLSFEKLSLFVILFWNQRKCPKLFTHDAYSPAFMHLISGCFNDLVRKKEILWLVCPVRHHIKTMSNNFEFLCRRIGNACKQPSFTAPAQMSQSNFVRLFIGILRKNSRHFVIYTHNDAMFVIEKLSALLNSLSLINYKNIGSANFAFIIAR